MKRRLIQLTPSQEARLAELVAADGNSLAAHIRTAVDLYLRTRGEDVDVLERPKPGRKKQSAREPGDPWLCIRCGEPVTAADGVASLRPSGVRPLHFACAEKAVRG